jgi:hypothetical protein
LVGEISQQLPNEVNLLFTLFWHGFTKRFNDILAFFRFFIDLGQDTSQMPVYVFFQNLSQPFGQSSCTQIPHIQISVDGMILEILFFFIQCD